MKDKTNPASNRSLRLSLAGYGMTVAGVALTTGVIHVVPGADHVTNISLLYLLVVIAAAYRFGSGPAVLASLLGVLSFDWFFVEPHYTLRANDPAEWLALGVFLVTAMVISHRTATLRLRIEEAQQRERETTVLAEASGAVASQVSHQQTLVEVLRRMTDVIGSEAAAIVIDGDNHQLHTIASYEKQSGLLPAFMSEPQQAALELVLEKGCAIPWDRNGLPATSHAVYLPLVMEQRVLGAVYLHLSDSHKPSAAERRVVESLANHAAVALERHRLAQAEAQAQALLEADKLKTALLSMVSHDFRSPLASIKASVTGLLQDGVLWDRAVQRELLSGINQETDRLNRMVGNILALSRLEADAWRPQCESVPLDEVIGAALDAFNAEENQRIAVTLDAALSEVWLDTVQIVQVLHNLLENALKYSPSGSPVDLSATQEGDYLVIEVADRGVGLPVSEEGHIFEQFYRAPRWRESASPGAGIGLAICRGLVEAHGGQLTASNRSGGGAVFRLTLPLRRVGNATASVPYDVPSRPCRERSP